MAGELDAVVDRERQRQVFGACHTEWGAKRAVPDSSLLMPPPPAKLPTPGGAAAIPPTPRTPHGLTPLPTPRRLKELISAGKLKKNWGEQTEVARTGQPKEPAIGSEGEAARELAKKRTAEELEQDAEEHVPELMLPPEVSKRIRMASESRPRAAVGRPPERACPYNEKRE